MAAPNSARHRAGLFKRVLARAFFNEFSVLRHAHFEAWQLVHQRGDLVGPHFHFLADYQSGVKSEGCDEITGLKLPFGKGAINDFES